MKIFLILSFLLTSSLVSAQARSSTAAANVRVLEKQFEMPGLARTRQIRIYLPPSYEGADSNYPVIYMHDGQNLFDDATSFVGEWGVDELLNEISAEGGPEFIVVGIDNGGELRLEELTPYPNPKYGGGKGAQYLAFIVEVIKPYIDEYYRTLPDAEHTCLMGSSLGGLITHYGIYTYPEVFSKAGVFSPSYWFSYEQMKQLTSDNPLPKSHRLNLLVGKKEGANMYLPMGEMVKTIKESGHPETNLVSKVVEDGEHNEKFWRSELKEALLWLFKEE